MSELTHHITFDMVSKALDAAALRHQVLATNIANANVANFRPSAVEFETHLADARSELSRGQSISAASLAKASARVVQLPGEHGGVANLDLQAAQLAQNTLHYQALTRALSRQVGILSLAINEGRK
jgi:flagellar basal-body rod protein FlgB